MVVTNLTVGTNGKLVIEPLPVTKKITLEPEATWPATLSRSLPGLSMKWNPGSVTGAAYSTTPASGTSGAFLAAAPIDFSVMLYRPRSLLPPDGLPAADCPWRAVHALKRSTWSRKAAAVARSLTDDST